MNRPHLRQRLWRGPLVMGLVSVLLGASMAAGPQAPASAGGVSLSIGPSSSWLDAYGLLHIVGYVRNNGIDVENTRVLIDLRTSNGAVLRTDTEYVQNVVMRPGDASPFDHIFTPPAGYASFRVHDPVALAGVIRPERVLTATVTAVNLNPSSSPYLLQGTVTNTGTKRVEAAKIQVIFLDDEGVTRWVAGTVAYTSTFDFGIEPGATASWVIVRRTDAPTTWTHFFAPLAEDSLYTGNLEVPGPSGSGIAPVPTVPGSAKAGPILRHAPNFDAPAVVPSHPLSDGRRALEPTSVPRGSGEPLTTLSAPRKLGAPLTWTSVLLPLLGAGLVLGLVFGATLGVLAWLRLRATDPDPRRA